MNGEVIEIGDEPIHARSSRIQKQTGPVSK